MKKRHDRSNRGYRPNPQRLPTLRRAVSETLALQPLPNSTATVGSANIKARPKPVSPRKAKVSTRNETPDELLHHRLGSANRSRWASCAVIAKANIPCGNSTRRRCSRGNSRSLQAKTTQKPTEYQIRLINAHSRQGQHHEPKHLPNVLTARRGRIHKPTDQRRQQAPVTRRPRALP